MAGAERRVVRWTELPDWSGVAALLGRAPGEVAAEHGALPAGIEGVALVSGERVLAVGLWVEVELSRVGRCALVRLSAPEAALAIGLVAWAEQRARRLGARSLLVREEHAPGAAALVAGRGYAVVNAMLTMRRRHRRPSLPLPPALAERTLDEVGLDAWVEIENAAFAGLPFAVVVSRTDAERQVASPTFDPSLLRFVCDDHGVVGMWRGVIDRPGAGEVESIGLAPGGRGRGLGRWLLRRCEAALDARGAHEVTLRVAASNAPAVGLYRAEGYVEVGRDVAWERGLRDR